MPVHDDLGTRMKEYEKRNQYYLQKRTPVAIRVDGRSFHTFTKGFKRPFDDILMKSMQETAKYMCENMGNAKLAYVQSDEITIILVDYDTLETDCWFNYRTDKLCSISASMATMAFNRVFVKNVDEWGRLTFPNWDEGGTNEEVDVDLLKLNDAYQRAIGKGAMFDARCFNIPKEEVTNLIYWRQLDATRNSIQMVGQANFSHKELQNKSCNMIQDMLHEQKGINWNDFPVDCKRGAAVIKKKIGTNIAAACGIAGATYENQWVIDRNMPMLKSEDRAYIDDLIYVGE